MYRFRFATDAVVLRENAIVANAVTNETRTIVDWEENAQELLENWNRSEIACVRGFESDDDDDDGVDGWWMPMSLRWFELFFRESQTLSHSRRDTDSDTHFGGALLITISEAPKIHFKLFRNFAIFFFWSSHSIRVEMIETENDFDRFAEAQSRIAHFKRLKVSRRCTTRWGAFVRSVACDATTATRKWKYIFFPVFVQWLLKWKKIQYIFIFLCVHRNDKRRRQRRLTTDSLSHRTDLRSDSGRSVFVSLCVCHCVCVCVCVSETEYATSNDSRTAKSSGWEVRSNGIGLFRYSNKQHHRTWQGVCTMHSAVPN